MAPMERPATLIASAEAGTSLEDSPPPEDSMSFEDFFELHHPPLFRALWLISRNRAEAEDVVQDAFLRLLERWDSVRSLADPEGYLYRTAMNVLRSHRRRALVALRRAVGHLPHDDQMALVESRDAVVRALAILTPRQRASIVLTEVLGLTSVEAAEALKVKPSTVRVLAARARHVLKDRLKEEDDG
jgi:RNA polymerase sigma-70 factor (ECF subfamily)